LPSEVRAVSRLPDFRVNLVRVSDEIKSDLSNQVLSSSVWVGGLATVSPRMAGDVFHTKRTLDMMAMTMATVIELVHTMLTPEKLNTY
jgi:hypothetical protein